MAIALTEIISTLTAFVLLSTVVSCGGAALAERLRFPGFSEGSRLERLGLALICGFGCLPVLLDFAGRLGPLAMTLAALALAALGAPALMRKSAAESALHPGWIIAALVWILGATALVVDMPGVGNLQHSLLAVDYVKHAAATWSLAESGAPPWNPTFYEPGRAMSYYYLFYTLPAVAATLGAPLGIAARHAVYASAPLMGFALFALAQAVLRRGGADAAIGSAPRAANWPLLALLFATGLDFFPLATLYFAGEGRFDFLFLHFSDWDEQVTSWFNSVMWVPHHVAALCAAMVGFVALTQPGGDKRRVLLAGLAFASMVGESVYVGLAAVVGAGLWLATLLWRRRFFEASQLGLAGLLALALAGPWLVTLLPRMDATGAGPAPVGFHLRGPQWIDLVAGSPAAGAPFRALSMPLFYLIDFGVFAVGAFVFWRKAGRRGYANELGLALLCLTASSFLIGSFLRSQILMNDLGWRVMLFAQLSTLVWTASAARQGLFKGWIGFVAYGSLAVGYGATAVAVAQLRLFFPLPEMRAPLADEIAAWSWLDAQLPRGSVVQVRPSHDRAYGYGLYGRFPVAAADSHNARLFGAAKGEIDERINFLAPIFSETTLSFDEARRRAERFNIAALVVSSLDPVFAAPDAWTASAKADYANPNFRIYLMNGSRHDERN
ncbi:hypothetical protein [Methylocystis parvus]|uniref:Uncharacterized protein n=1 Tax=Methylocystis parvus TaxID=134 RepID=A0A6B8M3V7_9HYPH|nr:hypothetical protein [Methylocystis parvus]QGM96998.1 hypothetical protein F7D14_05605 [Methylocystis parvus]WBJ99107.1 hypothetical protein MMG94_14010 [Methylocystis parvus OBBP]